MSLLKARSYSMTDSSGYRSNESRNALTGKITPVISIIIHKRIQLTKNKVHLKTGGLFLFQNCTNIHNLLNVSRG